MYNPYLFGSRGERRRRRNPPEESWSQFGRPVPNRPARVIYRQRLASLTRSLPRRLPTLVPVGQTAFTAWLPLHEAFEISDQTCRYLLICPSLSSTPFPFAFSFFFFSFNVFPSSAPSSSSLSLSPLFSSLSTWLLFFLFLLHVCYFLFCSAIYYYTHYSIHICIHV